jgi:hypothetical protein
MLAAARGFWASTRVRASWSAQVAVVGPAEERLLEDELGGVEAAAPAQGLGDGGVVAGAGVGAIEPGTPEIGGGPVEAHVDEEQHALAGQLGERGVALGGGGQGVVGVGQAVEAPQGLGQQELQAGRGEGGVAGGGERVDGALPVREREAGLSQQHQDVRLGGADGEGLVEGGGGAGGVAGLERREAGELVVAGQVEAVLGGADGRQRGQRALGVAVAKQQGGQGQRVGLAVVGRLGAHGRGGDGAQRERDQRERGARWGRRIIRTARSAGPARPTP